MWKYDREEEYNKNKENMLKQLFIIDMNKYDKKIVDKQKKLIDEYRKENNQINFVLNSNYELIDDYKKEIGKPNTRIYYKNNRNGMYNRTLQDEIKYYKNLKEIVIAGIDIYDFSIGLSNYLDEIGRHVDIFISRDTTNMKESFHYLNCLLDDRGIKVVEKLEYLKDIEKIYKLR